jgi:hypothetical protein
MIYKSLKISILKISPKKPILINLIKLLNPPNRSLIKVLTHRLKTHTIPRIPMEGYIVLKFLDHRNKLDFLTSTNDLKKYVFINLSEQIRQKNEGICAS